jgi:transcriptional regulator with XRE-family HTH domain
VAARRQHDDHEGTALSRALAAARTEAGLRQVPVSEAAGMTQARLSRIERGGAIPTSADMTALLDLYGVRGTRRRELETLADEERAGIKDQRLVVQRGHTAAMQSRWSRILHRSHLVRAFHPALVIGAIQVPAYAAVVLGLDADAMRERAEQQATLTSGPGQRHTFIQTEGSLRATVGSTQVMALQLAHLVEVSHLPNVRLGVIPSQHPMPFTCGTAFHLFQGDGFATAVVGLEVAAATLSDPKDVAHFTALFDRIADSAVYDDEARAVLATIAEDHGG